jgi:osmotically-inducible protein OsmY
MAAIVTEDVHPRAQAALANSPFYELRNVRVELCDHALLLSGTVSSFYHKQLAQEVVRSVCRETELINRICVRAAESVGEGA